MENSNNITSAYKKSNLENELLKEYVKSLKDPDFKKLVARLNIKEEDAKRYTSKLERTVEELKKCSKCKGLYMCQNELKGCVYYPKCEENNTKLRFDYVACKYKIQEEENAKNRTVTFDEPVSICNAKMSEIDLTDKKRGKLLKWINSFYKEYLKKEKSLKGLYLHGSFGCGKTYILAALLNELAKNKVKTMIIYYPELLRSLKASFNDGEFENKMDAIKHVDILLIDDIGAEAVSEWSRDEILGTILQYRIDAALTTFFTSNLNINELEYHLSNTKNSVDIVKAQRIIERIKALTEDGELISESRRT